MPWPCTNLFFFRITIPLRQSASEESLSPKVERRKVYVAVVWQIVLKGLIFIFIRALCACKVTSLVCSIYCFNHKKSTVMPCIFPPLAPVSPVREVVIGTLEMVFLYGGLLIFCQPARILAPGERSPYPPQRILALFSLVTGVAFLWLRSATTLIFPPPANWKPSCSV